jgi:hypothetical protein
MFADVNDSRAVVLFLLTRDRQCRNSPSALSNARSLAASTFTFGGDDSRTRHQRHLFFKAFRVG